MNWVAEGTLATREATRKSREQLLNIAQSFSCRIDITDWLYGLCNGMKL
jgi:hypothetical protein